jgi:hypothetical protein
LSSEKRNDIFGQGQLSDVTDAYLVPCMGQRCITQNETHDSIYLYLQYWFVGNKSVNYSKHSSKWALNCVCLLPDNFLYTLFLYLYSLIWCLKGSLKMEVAGFSWTLLPGWETKWYYWCDSGCFFLLEQIFSVNLKRVKRKTLYNGAIFVCVFTY